MRPRLATRARYGSLRNIGEECQARDPKGRGALTYEGAGKMWLVNPLICPKAVGPSNIPPRISETTRGWRMRPRNMWRKREIAKMTACAQWVSLFSSLGVSLEVYGRLE